MHLSNSVIAAEAMADIMFELCPSWSIDELLLHPDEAKQFCQLVRAKLCHRQADPEILRSLLNARKRGLLREDRRGEIQPPKRTNRSRAGSKRTNQPKALAGAGSRS